MAGARLAVKVVVNLSFCRDFHPAALRQLAWRTKLVHNFCRTLFQTPSGLAAQSYQSADRQLFTGEPLPGICAFTNGQAAGERHAQTCGGRCQVAYG